MILALKIIALWTVLSVWIWFGDPLRFFVRKLLLDRWFKEGRRPR